MATEISDILDGLLPTKMSAQRLFSIWVKVVGTDESIWSKPDFIKKKILYVTVQSSAVYQEYKVYKKNELLKLWNQYSPQKIVDIIFKVK